MKIQDARAVVTGGASGLGNAVARHISAHGGQVVILDVQEGPGRAAAAALGANALFVRCDVTSEAAVAVMTRPIARDLARFGIRCVSIAPGIFHTPMMDGMPREVQDSLAAQVPFPARLGNPEEFAQLVASVFEITMLNGTTIRLDGAIRMQPK